MKFGVIDFEAANAHRGSICSIGVAIVEGFQITDTFYSLVNPQTDFDPMCMRIHHIKPEDVASSPTFIQLWNEKLVSMLHGIPIVAYNASYDIYHLEKALFDAGITNINIRYACAMQLTKKWVSLPSYKLSKVAEHFDIVFDHHNALEDAKTTALILNRIASQHNSTDLDDLMKRSCMLYSYSKNNNYDPATDKTGCSTGVLSISSMYNDDSAFYNNRCVYIGNSLEHASSSTVKSEIVRRGGRVVAKLSSKVDTILIGFHRLERLETVDSLPAKGKEATQFALEHDQVILLDENQFFEHLGTLI